MPGERIDPTAILLANYEGIKASLQAQGREIGELKKSVERMPDNLTPVVRLAVLEGMATHIRECPALKGYAELLAQVREDSRVVNLVASGELTTKQRRENARATVGTVSISPNGVRVKLPAWIWKTAIGMIIAAALSMFGYVAKSDGASDPVKADADTEAHPATATSKP